MSVPLRKLAEEALALDAGDRLKLATELLDSVEGAPGNEWAAVWTEELRRRSHEADGLEVRGIEWSEARAHVLRALSEK